MTAPEDVALEWAQQFAGLLESMTGDAATAGIAPNPPEAERLWWEQRLTSGARSVPFLVGIEPETCRKLGEDLLRAAGIEDSSIEDARGTCFEAVAEAVSGMARALSARFGIPVGCEGGALCAGPGTDQGLTGVQLEWRGRDSACLAVAAAREIGEPRAAPPPAVRDVPAIASPPNAAALDVLMDVELPVSISFGRAELPLREVLKLGGGCIVELNRGASEPVDVLVNKSVIARGEVVVVEGNYGVRIQEIASRQERLKNVS